VTAMLDRVTDVEDEQFDDGEFELDLRVVESTAPIVAVDCDTSDGCGNTCQTSACSSHSNDPF
jgi:FxLD family lantipeptide